MVPRDVSYEELGAPRGPNQPRGCQVFMDLAPSCCAIRLGLVGLGPMMVPKFFKCLSLSGFCRSTRFRGETKGEEKKGKHTPASMSTRPVNPVTHNLGLNGAGDAEPIIPF